MHDINDFVKQKTADQNFGQRLATLRKSRGLTQTELGDKVGVSYRVIAYYEGETNYPPAHLLPGLAKALKISVEELLGIKKGRRQEEEPQAAALLRKLKKAERLPKRDQKALLHFLEAMLQKQERTGDKAA